MNDIEMTDEGPTYPCESCGFPCDIDDYIDNEDLQPICQRCAANPRTGRLAPLDTFSKGYISAAVESFETGQCQQDDFSPQLLKQLRIDAYNFQVSIDIYMQDGEEYLRRKSRVAKIFWQIRSGEVAEDDGGWSRAIQLYVTERNIGKFRLYRGEDRQIYGHDSVRNDE